MVRRRGDDKSRRSWAIRAGAVGLAIGLFLVPLTRSRAQETTLDETGSTLIFPLFQEWIGAYAKVSPGVHLTSAGTGSGAGIAEAIAGRVRIGTSDAYMSDQEATANRNILNIPLVISAQTVNYNLPGLGDRALRLSGPVLAAIYSGAIRDWDAPEIRTLNPRVSLPHHAIVPIRRADASGDTFIFTQFLSFSNPDWENRIGYGTTVKWPSVAGGLTATGNAEMVRLCARTPYSIAYVGASFATEIAKAGLGTAMLQNEDGKFVSPDAATISAAAASLTPRTPADERLTLVFAPGAASYPLINYEYAIVSNHQPDANTAAALRDFLLWCISPAGGSAANFLDPVHFIPLPTAIRAKSELQIAAIQ
jgi:phosphate transport system substrate-binding protein